MEGVSRLQNDQQLLNEWRIYGLIMSSRLFIASSLTPPPDHRGTTRHQDSSSDFRRSNTRGSSMQQSNRKRDYTNRICFQRWIQKSWDSTLPFVKCSVRL